MTSFDPPLPISSPVFEDIRPGLEIPSLVRGPMTNMHLMRWSSAIENWHRIHYDQKFAIDHEGLPGLLVNGSWKQHFITQMLWRWIGPDGWLASVGFQFRKMNVAGETLTAWGRVTDTREVDGFGVVDCEVGIRNENGDESTPGTAIGVLQLDGGRPVPYPFPGLGNG